jgi:hypothetical protein
MRPRHVVAALHLAEPSGPTRALQPVLVRLAEESSIAVAVPGPGRVADEMRAIGRVALLGHEPLVFPRGVGDAAVVARRLRRDVRRFRGLLRSEHADLAIVSTTTLPSLVAAARLERVPTILCASELWRHGLRSDVVRRPLGRAAMAFETALADVAVACSRTVADALPRSAPSVVMYPPIDPDPAPGDAAGFRRRCGIPATSPCLATLGNVSRGRGQDTAIRALADLRRDHPGARLVVAGAPHPRAADRVYAAELVELARALGVADALHLVGVARAADVFAVADVVLNPARFPETFGIVAAEALAAGRPVVSTDVGAVPEVLSDGEHALLVPVDRPDALAAAVRRLLHEPGLAERLVARGAAHVRATYAPERVLPRFDEAIALALAGRRREG